MSKLCADCNQEIIGRERSAKFCWSCCDLRPKKNGQVQAAIAVNKAVRNGILAPVATLTATPACPPAATPLEHNSACPPAVGGTDP